MPDKRDDVVQAVADELRQVADDLEDDDLTLTEPMRITRVATTGHQLPSEIEITYYVPGAGERTVEVWI